MSTNLLFKAASYVLTISLAAWAQGAAPSRIVGELRIEELSPTLVRIEQKGPEGFEDRPTFHVINRDWPGGVMAESFQGNQILLKGPTWEIRIARGASNLNDVRIESFDGKTLWTFDGKLDNNVWLPAPSEHPEAWSIADTPRLARAPQGAIPAPPGSQYPQTSGWDPNNNAPDVYVFLPNGNTRQLRADYLKLTGPTEMPPLFALGAWDSRWYEYTEQTALKQIDDYRKHDIPLDVLVIDTDWRVGGSHGYDVNTHDFPDLPRFFREAHAKHVRVMFNDHPEPVAKSALDPEEMQFRFDHLSKLLKEGLDIWWFDRNWSTHLLSPMPGLRLEAWGMEVYHDTTLAVRPDRRALIMANVDGIDNGIRHAPPDMGAHRYPIQWTGDIGPGFAYLRRAVENAVHSGVAAAFAYESDDLGGHVANPTVEQYIRWVEYGALSPIYRPHCTRNLKRMPWAFGKQAERIARDYIKMRYRLLPVLYTAARRNYDTGEPILRRLDLDYPKYAEASRNDEYLIGHNILVAPVLSSATRSGLILGSSLHTADGQPGLTAEYFDNPNLAGNPVLKRIDTDVNFDWGQGSPSPKIPVDHFSVRWTGTIGPIPDDAGRGRILSLLSDDGVRAWIDGKRVINAWGPQDGVAHDGSQILEPGKTYSIKIEYMEITGGAICQLNWRDAKSPTTASRSFWLPPGTWIDAWTGERFTGPKMITMHLARSRIPLLIKAGAVLPLAPNMQYTGQKPWDPIALDIYPAAGMTTQTSFYEDDGISNAYEHGASRWTKIAVTEDVAGKNIRVKIDPARGSFTGALTSRGWNLRLHLPSAMRLSSAMVDGKPASAQRLAPDPNAMPFSTTGGAADGDIVELRLRSTPVSQPRIIALRLSLAPGPRREGRGNDLTK